MRRAQLTLLALLLMATEIRAECVPLGGENLRGFRLVSLPNIDARMEFKRDGVPLLKLMFEKETPERRLLAIETTPSELRGDFKTLSVIYRLHIARGKPPRLAIVVYQRDGGVFYRVARLPLRIEGFDHETLPLASMAPAAFSEQESELDWGKVGKIWLGLALDGSTVGSIEISNAHLTTSPYRASRPLVINLSKCGVLDFACDKAVRGRPEISHEGQRGALCVKFDFAMPGRRHMYALPTLKLETVGVEGYSALRFTYSAQLPEGIEGLLVLLRERDGSQYYATPPPQPTPKGEWRTIRIPFENFKLGGWSRDENGKLDLSEIAAVSIGLHGTASAEFVKGSIRAADIAFVP